MTSRKSAVACIFILSLILGGCHRKYQPHPNAINTTDSAAYDALLEAKTIINEAKVQYGKGGLPADAKEYINDAVRSYDVAEITWHLYHDMQDASQEANLKRDLDDLANAVARLKSHAGVR